MCGGRAGCAARLHCAVGAFGWSRLGEGGGGDGDVEWWRLIRVTRLYSSRIH